MLARGSIPFRLPDRQMPSQMLARMARGGRARVRFADGGSLLSNALDAVTAPDPSGSSPITQTRTVTPFPGDYNTYGEGPEWNWFDYLNSGGTGAPPPVTPPAGTPPPPGTPGAGGTGNQATGGAGSMQGSNGFGGKGPLGNGAQQAAADAASRNTAATPSLKGALGLGLAAAGPLGMMSALAKEGLNALGVSQVKGPFDVAGPTLSPAQQAAIANSTNQMQNPSLVAALNQINNAVMAQRGLANSSNGNFGGGIGFAGAGDPVGAGQRAAAAAMGRGSSAGDGGGGNNSGGGDRGAGTQGGPGGSPGGGLGGGYRLAKGGKARMKGLGWMANGGRLHLAGGGSTDNFVLTSLVPILAGLVGNITSGPIGGALASGAATAMTGGSLQDAASNVGPDAIDTFFKYFAPLIDGGSDQSTADTTAQSQNTGIAALLNKLTSRVPTPTAAATVPGPASTSGLYIGRGSMPGTSMATGGELDARGGTHVQGEGDGQSDDIPAKLSDGEFVWDAASVSALGNGSNKEGAARLEQMRKMVRQKAGYKNVHTIPPKQKSVAALLGAVTQRKAA